MFAIGSEICVSTFAKSNVYYFYSFRISLKSKNVINFHPLKFVGRGSETHLQVGGKLHKIAGEELNNSNYTTINQS